MAYYIIIILLILFILADLAIRNLLKRYRVNKEKRERERILEESLHISYTTEAKTLKRVEVENPSAKILCVDDEEVILDSFRKILVVNGFSVDTVESGKEALGLVQRNHYDFVFTDLKMPEMPGEEVCKSVKNIRPDIDVIIITGYATIESAVACMKYGAMDYVQKPFTEDELVSLTKEFVIKRNNKIHNNLRPKVHITQTDEAEPEANSYDFHIPGGVFISHGHCWVAVEESGKAKVGLDDFAKKIIGGIDGIEMPNLGMEVYVGQNLFHIKKGVQKIPFLSPLSGKVVGVNKSLSQNIDDLEITPYSKNWVCEIESENLDAELQKLMIGKKAVSYFQDEIDGLDKAIKSIVGGSQPEEINRFEGIISKVDDQKIEKLSNLFFNRT